MKSRIHIAYPNNSAALTTGGGLVFTGLTDGTFIAYDDTTFAELWKINVGTGFNAPPMTFEVGRQAVCRDPCGAEPDRPPAPPVHARAARNAQPDHAVRVRAVTSLPVGRAGWGFFSARALADPPNSLRSATLPKTGRKSAAASFMRRAAKSKHLISRGRPTMQHPSLRSLLLAGSALAFATSAFAADVTPERLANPEPGNWLTNHRTYDAQRYSPLDKINKANIKALKLAYAVAIGGTAVNENLKSTPLAEDGFLYVIDQWGVLYKIDARSGDVGRIVWRMDPGAGEGADANRGAALWGNFVISVANYPPRRDRHRQGDRQGRLGDQHRRRPGRTRVHGRAARGQGQDRRRRLGRRQRRARLHRRASTPRPASSRGANTSIPAPGEPGSETWKDKNNAWQTGGGAMWVTGSYDPRDQPGAVGHRQSGAVVGSVLSAGRQSLHRQPDLVGPRQRQDELVSPVHAGRHVGL